MFSILGLGIGMFLLPLVVMIAVVVSKLDNVFRTIARLEGDARKIYIRHTMRVWFATIGQLILAGCIIWFGADKVRTASLLSVLGMSMVVSAIAIFPVGEFDKDFCTYSGVVLTIGIICVVI